MNDSNPRNSFRGLLLSLMRFVARSLSVEAQPRIFRNRLGCASMRNDGQSAADRVHRSIRLNEPRRVDLVPFFFGRDAVPNRLGDLVVASTRTQHLPDVGLLQAEQAVPQLTVRRDAKPIAAHAEGTADR